MDCMYGVEDLVVRLRSHTDVQTQLNPVVTVCKRECGDGAERSASGRMLLIGVDGDAHFRRDRILWLWGTQSRTYGGDYVGEPGHVRERNPVLLDMSDKGRNGAEETCGRYLRGRGRPDTVGYVGLRFCFSDRVV